METDKVSHVGLRLKCLLCWFIAGLLVAPLFVFTTPQVAHHYSLSQILSLLEKQEGHRLYFQVYDSVVRVTLVPADRKLLLDIVSLPPSDANPAVIARLPPSHRLVRDYLSASFDSSLIMISCGDVFGDDRCDQYNPLRGSLKVGDQIGENEKGAFDIYLQAIGKILA